MSDTERAIVPASGAGVFAPREGDKSPTTATRRRRTPWAVVLAAIGIAVPAAVMIAAMTPARSVPGLTRPYARVPSEAFEVSPRIAVTEVERYDASGEFLLVTIREPELDGLSWWVGRGEDEVLDGLTPQQKFGTLTPSQERQRNRLLMSGAKNTAQFVALSKLGYDVEVIPGEIVVDSLVCLEANEAGGCARSAPADDVLDPDDHILEVDGVQVDTVDDLTRALTGRRPGDVVELRIDREGVGETTVPVTLIAAPGEEDRTIIGFVPFDTSEVVLPFEVAIDTDSIGGPSAGLAFTLALIDELTPGELTGGRRVAVTGTIQADGSVGPIGGLVQKVEAVVQSGAEVFLVPSGQGDDALAEARAVAGDDVEVIPVATVDEALAALARLGGNGLELGTSGATSSGGG